VLPVRKVMKRLICLAALATAAFAGAQTPIGDHGVMRMVVKHGDPWMVKALIEGIQISQPELSTILGFAGIPDQESDLLASLFGRQGTLVVNPTDNSIIFFPK
jgi:hypothetical protein